MDRQTLSCEKIYQIWKSEPEVIHLLDLRSAQDFQNAHIPGAIHASLESVQSWLEKYPEKLMVILCDPLTQTTIEKKFTHEFSNFVFFSECRMWQELDLPQTGTHGNIKVTNLKNMGTTMKKTTTIFHQLFDKDSSTYTYIIGDATSKQVAIIDPVLEQFDRDAKLIEELGYNLIYILDTHIHADHITAATKLKERFQAKNAVSQHSQVTCADLLLEEGQELMLGDKTIFVFETPGHTDSCLTYLFEGLIFTGDVLLVRTCGRTDFQQGSAEKMYNSIHEKLYKLADETIIYPGHDYKGFTHSTIAEEKKLNSRIKEVTSVEEFSQTMRALKLDPPKRLHEAVPANMKCGKVIS